MTFAQWLWELAKRAGGKRRRRTAFAPALLLILALATGCAARATTSPDGSTTVEIDTRGGAPDSSRAVPVAPPGPAAATPSGYAAGDATVNAMLRDIARAACLLDWRGVRQACADVQEYAKGRERGSAGLREPAVPVATPEAPDVRAVRARAEAAFWEELER